MSAGAIFVTFAPGLEPTLRLYSMFLIGLTVFGVFMVTVLGEAISWRHLAAFACIMAAAAFLFVGK